jgi:hypothetical protein
LKIDHASLHILGYIVELNIVLVNSPIIKILFDQMMTDFFTHDLVLDSDSDSAGSGLEYVFNINILSLSEGSFKSD